MATQSWPPPHHLTPPFPSSLAGHTQTMSRLRMANAKGSSAGAGHSDLGWAILHEQHQAFMASVLRTRRHKCAPLAALPPIPRCLVHRRSSVSCFPPPTLLRVRQECGNRGKEAMGARAGAIGGNPATRKFARPKRVDAGREAIGEEKGALLEGQQ